MARKLAAYAEENRLLVAEVENLKAAVAVSEPAVETISVTSTLRYLWGLDLADVQGTNPDELDHIAARLRFLAEALRATTAAAADEAAANLAVEAESPIPSKKRSRPKGKNKPGFDHAAL